MEASQPTEAGSLLVQDVRELLRLLGQIADGAQLSETMPTLARHLDRLVPGQRCTIMRSDRTGSTLNFLAAPNLPDSWVSAFEGVRIGPGAGACPTAASRRTTVICADIETDPLWDRMRGVALAHGVRAVWSVPLLADDGELLGVMGCCADKPGAPPLPHSS